ncbi:MAG TPA: hypothetical protein VJ939_09760 [Bacteroidales bacterium]|nr:hypothetical protein [Bacteroidales bacterium]
MTNFNGASKEKARDDAFYTYSMSSRAFSQYINIIRHSVAHVSRCERQALSNTMKAKQCATESIF